ncbi:uncharacterized protein FTOL_10442 [Fusarium torulosum]|uniref:Uncharacterized protein n=1 Tax=Fusarium torulosum TaxID=33205 RepID=A0AAE8MGA5_9HYPO|nr:uncharacterized protein FTOL_10442 [Fusarium torulosum]
MVVRFAGTDNAIGNGFGVLFFITTLLYTVFIFASLVGAGVNWYFFPETNGLSLEEIGVLFGDEVATAALASTTCGMKRVRTLTTGIEVSDGNMNDNRDAKAGKNLKV